MKTEEESVKLAGYIHYLNRNKNVKSDADYKAIKQFKTYDQFSHITNQNTKGE